MILLFCKGLQTAHQYTHDNVSICLCLGVARGAWKCAPIIPLLRQNALIQHAHPVFFDNPNTQVVSTVNS